METKANYALIGAFTLAGFLGILGFVLWFAQLQLDRQFAYYDVYFPEVSGLGPSSEVRFAGLAVGRVVDMQLAPGNPLPVRVRLEVTLDTPIRADSTAALEVQGVTGVALVAVSAGSSRTPLLREADTSEVPVIASSRSALQTLTDEGPQIIERLGLVAEQLTLILGEENQVRVTAILDNVERSSGNLDQALDDVATATQAISTAATGIAAFGGQMDGLSRSAGTTLDRFADAATQAETTLAAATATLEGVDGYVSGDLTTLTQQLERSAAGLTTLTEHADASLDGLDTALASGTRAFDAAETVVTRDLAPVAGDLRTTLAALNTALARLPDDLPQISASLRQAADAASAAFTSLRGVVEGAGGPVQSFAGETLPQIGRLSQDMRALVENMSQLVSTLRRDPTQLLSGPRTPEFRR
ncbi:MCE family protein [Paracoccus liaowanqingii]|uniref:MCE family protein n=1 Tax=Paracoccus liaowanqingii TaxID=2560053 RepID=A0A4Z1C9U8_9RHOB|nr:MlaD family protein [Paracoccus liaowanqingii]TGN57825.1 MCE family protein [Paracoccus liaowanqingii]